MKFLNVINIFINYLLLGKIGECEMKYDETSLSIYKDGRGTKDTQLLVLMNLVDMYCMDREAQVHANGVSLMARRIAIRGEFIERFDDIQFLEGLAYAHDLCEDTVFKGEDEALSEEFKEGLRLLTRVPHESYSEYIYRMICAYKRGGGQPLYLAVLLVKLADLLDHLMQPCTLRGGLRTRYLEALDRILYVLKEEA